MTSTKSPQVMGPAPNTDVTTLQKLMPNGANWVSFKRRMCVDIAARPQLQRHLEGHTSYPTPPTPLKSKPTQDEQDKYDEGRERYEDAVDLWRMRDAVVQRQIIHNIPDSILIRIQSLTTAAEMWEALRREFEGRTPFVQNEIDRMRYMFEELSSRCPSRTGITSRRS